MLRSEFRPWSREFGLSLGLEAKRFGRSQGQHFGLGWSQGHNINRVLGPGLGVGSVASISIAAWTGDGGTAVRGRDARAPDDCRRRHRRLEVYDPRQATVARDRRVADDRQRP